MNKAGTIAIVGKPNVGKSSLLNAILDTKLSIVSAKPQTTRNSILGILNEKEAQLLFLDTPGWVHPRDELQAQLKGSILRAIEKDADVILWVTEPGPQDRDDNRMEERLHRSNKPIVTALNKVDLIEESDGCGKKNIFPVSARKKTGLKELVDHLIGLLPLSPPYFPEGQLTDRWERFYVAELIRETIFEKFHDEIPHATAVQVEEFAEKPGMKDVISAVLYVESEGQKGIVIGKKGSAIRAVGEASRKSIEALLGRGVYLNLKVRVQKNWRKNKAFLSSLHSGFE